jgi:hypothetical protein
MALVIDLGCGTGRFSDLMAAHSVSKWIGVSRERRLPPPTGRAIENPPSRGLVLGAAVR